MRSGTAPETGRLGGLLRAAGGVIAALVAAVAVFGTAQSAAASPGQHNRDSNGGTNAHGARHWRFDDGTTTLAEVADGVGADQLWRLGLNGSGVGVALIDTGVVPVDGLRSGNVVNGPDLSVESQAPVARYLDTEGHGTHLAGIIAGYGNGFRGIAPGATLTSIKVGAFDGTVDVSQVIAAVDWVVAHRNDDPAHPIRVLNLSYGTDGTQDYRLDPLVHAVENAWRAGIVVVVAAGNGGSTAPSLANPAYDPYVIAVGASDLNGTASTSDDAVTDFSSRGNAQRRVDLVAPGRSIVSLRDPGSFADANNPSARVGDRFFKGSGTSQSAAVVSGAVALLLDQRGDLSPDQVKAALTRSANRLRASDAASQGAGELDLAGALRQSVGGARQGWTPSSGRGSLEQARGSAHIAAGDAVLAGENDLFGPFDTAAWATASSNHTAWVGGTWMGRQLTGTGWTGSSWTARTWSGLTWSGLTWSGLTWSGLTWSGLTWSGLTWSGLTWSGLTWSGLTWSGLTWSGITWSDATWAGLTWSDSTWGG